MAYVIGQYNHNSDSGDDSDFITPILSGTPTRRENLGDIGVIGYSSDPFEDECIKDLNLAISEYYYCRCQIKRMDNPQTFTIKLVNYDDKTTDAPEQFIKQIVVKGGDNKEWVNVEFIFHPIVSFDTILFQLQRTIEDYTDFIRFPKIAYEQLGSINNIINSKIRSNISLLKIGVQSHPGLTMCINGEEIHISRTGIFEVKNGVIPINFFSVVNAATEQTSGLEDWKNSINQRIEDIKNDPTLTPEQKQDAYEAIQSKCFFDPTTYPKNYSIDAFALDYMYNN